MSFPAHDAAHFGAGDVWADVLIAWRQPNVDPDWRNNPTYLTITWSAFAGP